MDHNFDDLKYKIGKGTKEMVNKIFKAAANSNNDNQKELNSLLDQIEKRAQDMCKPSVLPDLPPPNPERDIWRNSQGGIGSAPASEGPMLIEENAPGSNIQSTQRQKLLASQANEPLDKTTSLEESTQQPNNFLISVDH